MMKKILTVLLVLAMVLCAGCATADVPYIERSWNGSAVVEAEKTLDAGSYKVVTSCTEPQVDSSKQWYATNCAWYVVRGNVTIAHRLTVQGTVHLVLCDGAVLTAEQGITVADENELIIHGQSGGTGKLIASTNNHYAGIGGISESMIEDFGSPDSGDVTIHGGEVEATGGVQAAGIGGANSGNGGTVTIFGGTVEATGGEQAAGIGGGHGGFGSTVTIYGGSVEANGGSLAAGIGGEVTVHGGEVEANGGEQAAGIGGGPVTINDGTVTANGGSYGAGIGGGYGGSGCTVTINGGTVTANGGSYGAGIGGGNNGSGGPVTINGGTVTATGGTVTLTDSQLPPIVFPDSDANGGAGIGGGDGGDGGTVIITGGNVKAEGKGGSADIGRGTGGALDGNVKDGNGHDVSLKRITLSGAADGTAVTAADGLTGYGLKDVGTIGESLYFYLPENAQANAITANGTTYQHADGNIFMPEETTDDPDDPDGMPMYPNMTDCENGYRNEDGRELPKTGDASMLGAWVCLLGASAAGLGKMKKKS